MSTTPATARQHLLELIASALEGGASASDLVALVIETGWQPRPTPDPDSDYLEGVLDDGRRVPIEVRRAPRTAGRSSSPAASSS